MHYKRLFFFILFFLIEGQLDANEPYNFLNRFDKYKLTESKALYSNSIQNDFKTFNYTNDSTKLHDSGTKNEKKGFKPYIIPSLLITSGTALHFSTTFKQNVQDFTQEHLKYNGNIDDYLQFAPVAAVYGLQAFGVSGKNNFGNSTAILIKTVLLRDFMVTTLKRTTGVSRPSGGNHSFPSGHTSFAFSMAHFMHREYGHRSVWYSVAAYSSAAAVGYMRVAKNAHWISDVVAGAGIGMLCTELIYLTHQYKWDNEHLKNFDIFPFSSSDQKGLTLVYHF